MPALSTIAFAGSALGILLSGTMAVRAALDTVRDGAAGQGASLRSGPAGRGSQGEADAALLSKAMANRYAAATMLACGATAYGHMMVISFLFAVFAFVGLADAWIHSRDGAPYSKHLIAGIGAVLVSGAALAAIFQTGAGA